MLFESLRRRLAFRSIAILLPVIMAVMTTPAGAQTETGTAVSGTEKGPTPPGTESPDQDFRFTIAWISTAGGYLYLPERWGDLRINLVNSRDEPRELLCTTYFNDRPNMQFGRRVWVPARSILHISHPVVIPPCDPNKGRTLNIQSLIVDSTEGSDVLVKNRSGQLMHDGALLVTHTPRNTAVIGKVGDAGAKVTPPQEVTDLIEAGRVNQTLPRHLATLIDTFLPADESGWNCFDHVVIAEDRIQYDVASLTALRNWIHKGGRLWVMVDQVNPIILEKLLGDDFRGHLVDRVGLTSVRVDKAPSLSTPETTIGITTEYEVPVDLARMVCPGFEVISSVDGWPAAMTKTFGEGTILVTTLGPRGWMRPNESIGSNPNDPNSLTPYVVTDVMKNIAADFFAVRQPELLPQSALEPQIREYIGYSIPSWGTVVGTLIGFSAVLLAIAIILAKWGRAESLAWIGSLLAIVTSTGLLLVGRAYRHGIPATQATVQLVQAMEGTDGLREQGVVAIYQPEESTADIKIHGGGQILPDLSGLENSPRRMVTTDLGEWHWENLPQPSGLRTTAFSRADTVENRIEARATFDSRGIIGKLTGAVPAGQDPMIASRNGRLGVTFDPTGAFTGLADDVFEKDQYLGSSYVNDEQDRRRRTLKKLFTNSNRKDFPARPLLMFWQDQWSYGFDFGSNIKPSGASLISVPLVLDRPPNGTEYVIPSILLPYRNQTDPDGNPSTTMWNFGRNEWQERSAPGTAWLNFRIPEELLPLTVNKAKIDLTVSGPVGKIEFLGIRNKKAASLKTIIDPVGSLSIELNEPELLSIQDNGGLVLALNAGDPDRPELTETPDSSSPKRKRDSSFSHIQNTKVNYWKIESLRLQLWVKSTEPSLKDQP